MLLDVFRDSGFHLDECIAALVYVEFHRIDAAADGIAVVPVALIDLEIAAQVVAVQVAQLRVDRDLADPVAIAFADIEGEEEARPVRRQFGLRRQHLEVDVAVLQVEAPQQFLVEVQPLRIVLVGARQKAPPALLAAVDHLRQAVLAELVVADEDDLADQRHRAVVYLEHHIDAVLIEPDHLGIDARVVVALLGIQIEDVLTVLLGQRRGEHGARLELHIGTQLIVRELVVALEGDAVHQRVLDHMHDQRVALAIDLHVLEQAGGVERLQAAIESVGVERVALLHQHVGQDRPGLDSLIAIHFDGRDGAAIAHRGACRAGPGGRRPRRSSPLRKRGTDGRQDQQTHDKQPCGAGTNQTPPSSAVRHTRIVGGNHVGYSNGAIRPQDWRPGCGSAPIPTGCRHSALRTLCEWRRQGCRQR